MAKFNIFQRALRKIGPLRRLVLFDLKRARKSRADAMWLYEQSVLANIGLYITIWAGIERMLNTFIQQYHPHANQNLKEKLPSDLGAKIKYLATVAKDQRLPFEVSNSILHWVTELGEQRDYRHLIVHGFGVRKKRYTDHEWTFQNLVLKGNEAILVEKTFGNDELNQRLDRASELSQNISRILTPILFDKVN
ncbi:MAG: hypothetical protein V7676_02380 [Parasphingorhabdus sp.]|uniref:hypothetical protein n=1 Tax=Parasphingorhabdus sp. TaxID=2709688 RepID=UPI003002CF17